MTPIIDVGGEHRSLRDEVTDAVRDLITTGRIPPGARLHERRLSADLNVSRVPLREAILQLSVEGLVDLEPRKGAFAAPLDRTAVGEIFDVREVLEPLAARLAADRRTAADLLALRESVRGEVTASDRAASHAHDVGFHEALIEAAHHAVLDRLMTPLQHHLRRLFLLTSSIARLDMGDEHRPLVEAIEARDGALAAQAARDHVRAVRAATMPMVGERPTPA